MLKINRAISIILITAFLAAAFSLNAAAENLIVENDFPLSIGFIDGHCDTITTAMKENQKLYNNNLHIDFERLKEYGAPVQVFTVWCDNDNVKNAFDYANSAIDFFEEEILEHSDIIELALSADDIIKNAGNNKISAILALEGGEPLEGDIKNLDHFYNRGVRLITLTWNRENELGYGVSVSNGKGLKPFGIRCVERMNELGIIIDVSHLNEPGFWDVHELSTKPYIASHSNAYAVTPNKRNLTDSQIKAISEKGGIIGLNLYPYFLSNSKKAGMNDIMNHIKYFSKLGVLENIGLGCDFDGVEVLPSGILDVSSLKTLNTQIKDTFGEDVSSAIMFGNYLDFFIRFFE